MGNTENGERIELKSTTTFTCMKDRKSRVSERGEKTLDIGDHGLHGGYVIALFF